MVQHRNLENMIKEMLVSLIIVVLLTAMGIFGVIIEGLDILSYIAIVGLLIMIIYVPFLFRRVWLALNRR